LRAATAAATTPDAPPDANDEMEDEEEELPMDLSFLMATGNCPLLLAKGGTGLIMEGLPPAIELGVPVGILRGTARETAPEPTPPLPEEDFSDLGLRLVAAVALLRVDMLGLPEDPCLGE